MGKDNRLKKITLYKVGGAIATTLLLLMSLLYFFQFDDTITEEDRYYAQLIADEYKLVKPSSFKTYKEEIIFIQSVRNAVINMAPAYDPIPFYHERNVKDFYEKGSGMCFDKSFVIEKMLRIYGFEVRHASIYYTTPGRPALLAVLSKSYSHATLEVKTSKGWMLLDSLTDVTGLDYAGNPLTVSDFREWIQSGKAPADLMNDRHYGKPYICVYGLYSRHGTMFPPYNIVPDYNFRQLWYNIGI